MKFLMKKLSKIGVEFRCGEELRRYTTFRIGGPADVMFFPKNYFELLKGLHFAAEEGLPVFFLGGGSNLLVRDGGLRAVVINLRHLKGLQLEGERLSCEAGVTIPEVLSFCMKKGLSGLEFLAGVPATVGGAVVMNAGAFGQEVKDVLSEVTIFQNGHFRNLKVGEIPFSYRSWGGPSGAVVLRATFSLEKIGSEDVRHRMATYLKERRAKQPLRQPSAGCVFKNPKEVAAGFLIEEVGLKGFVHGRVAVSDKHANFIVNLGGGRAEEVLFLINHIKERVFRAFGIELEEEVAVVGEA